MLKINISDIYSHQYIKIKINLDDDLPLEKTLNMHNAVILTKSVFLNKLRSLLLSRSGRKILL